MVALGVPFRSASFEWAFYRRLSAPTPFVISRRDHWSVVLGGCCATYCEVVTAGTEKCLLPYCSIPMAHASSFVSTMAWPLSPLLFSSCPQARRPSLSTVMDDDAGSSITCHGVRNDMQLVQRKCCTIPHKTS